MSSGMGIGTVLGLVLGILVLFTLFTGIVSGGLGDSIREGMGLLGDKTDFTVEVRDKQTLSNISKYVYDRASNDGCASLEDGGAVAKQNENGGYPGLEGTYLTRYPKCRALSSSPAAGIGGALQEQGMDSEGIFSRVMFKIPDEDDVEPITLYSHVHPEADSYLEKQLLVASKESLENAVSSCSTVTQRYVGTGDYYLVFFNGEDVSSRSSVWVRDPGGALENRIYCNDNINIKPRKLDNFMQKSPVGDVFLNNDEYKSTIKLCPGDKGYVQMNKDKPLHEGEAGENLGGNANSYPFIQITSVTQESC